MHAPSPSALTRTHVHFRPSGFFATDARIAFAVDGVPIGEGTLFAGTAFEIALAPGAHVLEGTLKSGFITRKQQWTFVVPSLVDPANTPEARPDGVFSIRVLYNRFWGTFDKALETRVVTDAASLDAVAAPETSLTPDGPVVSTWIVLALLVVCFAAELLLPIGPAKLATPSIHTLLGMGGLDVAHTTSGQWFRLLSCTFLHADALHLLFNGIAIAFGGWLIEKTVGPIWFLFLYVTGAVVGSLVSLALNDGTMVSVGASGAGLSLFGAGLFIAWTLPPAVRRVTQFQLVRVLIPSLIPFATTHGARVDFGAHLGGFLAGIVIGALFLFAVRRAEGREGSALGFRRSKLALVGVLPFVVALPLTIHGVARAAYPEARELATLEAALLPNGELASAAPSPEQLRGWLERYPDDPRVLVYAAEAARDQEDWAAADAAIARGREAIPRFGKMFEERSITAFRSDFDAIERDVAVRRRLLPNKELPSGTPEEVSDAWDAHLREWLERYPDDPRLHEKAMWRADSTDEMAAHVEQGLAHVETFAQLLTRSDEMRAWLRYGQAIVLFDRQRDGEARAVLAVLCQGSPSEASALAHKRGDCRDPDAATKNSPGVHPARQP